MTIAKFVRTVWSDPGFRRGWRRGAGIVLAAWVIVQLLTFLLWPLLS